MEVELIKLQEHGEAALLALSNEFKPSPAALSSIQQITDACEIEFITRPEQPENICGIIGVLARLIDGSNATSDDWNSLKAIIKAKTEEIGLCKYLQGNYSKFDFSESNITLLKAYIASKKIDLDSAETSPEQIIKLLVPLLKEALAYAGIAGKTVKDIFADENKEKIRLEGIKSRLVEFANSIKVELKGGMANVIS